MIGIFSNKEQALSWHNFAQATYPVQELHMLIVPLGSHIWLWLQFCAVNATEREAGSPENSSGRTQHHPSDPKWSLPLRCSCLGAADESITMKCLIALTQPCLHSCPLILQVFPFSMPLYLGAGAHSLLASWCCGRIWTLNPLFMCVEGNKLHHTNLPITSALT